MFFKELIGWIKNNDVNTKLEEELKVSSYPLNEKGNRITILRQEERKYSQKKDKDASEITRLTAKLSEAWLLEAATSERSNAAEDQNGKYREALR